MTLPDRVDVLVVGAGLAGLAAAGAIQEAGWSVAVAEASDGVGGRVRTDEVDGFLLDRGFQVVLTAYPEVERQLDVAALDLRRFDPGALVHLDGGLHRVADPLRRPSTALGSLLAPIGSPADKVRVGLLQRRLRASDPRRAFAGEDASTLDALRAQGFSDTVIDRFFRPLFGGIQLDLDLTGSRRMFELVLRCLTVGDAAVPAAGMGAIPQQLVQRLAPGTVSLASPIERVEPGRATLRGGRAVEADRIVVATDGPTAAAQLGLPAVTSRHASCVWFAAERAPFDHKLIALDGTGRGPAANVAVLSNVAPGYAPEGQALIAAACPGVADGALEPSVRAQLRGWFGAEVGGWRHLRTDAIHHAQPDARPAFDPKQQVDLGEGLFVCGDHRDTPSIQGALHSGARCAGAVLASRT